MRLALLVLGVHCAWLSGCSREPGVLEGDPQPSGGSIELPEAVRSVYAADLNPEGTWTANWIPGSDSTRLEISLLADGQYSFEVWRTPDYGTSYHFETRAAWREGALWPKGTDANTHGAALYPARVEGQECLIPTDSLELLPCADLWSAQAEHAFRRVQAKPPPEWQSERVTEIDEFWLRGYLPGPEDENVAGRIGDE